MINLESVSGEFTATDYFNKGNFRPPQPSAYRYKGPIQKYANHTEQKIVEYLYTKYKSTPNIKGEVEIISERKFCNNCTDIVDQFQRDFPNIRVTRVEIFQGGQ